MEKNTSNQSAFIRGTDATVERWALPDVTRPGAATVASPAREPNHPLRPPTAKEIEEIRHAAYEEGFSQGRNEGLQQGQDLIRNQLHELDLLMQGLQNPYQQMDDAVYQEVSELSLILAQQIIRRELQTQPGEIVGLVREAVAMLPSSERAVRIVVHPDDAELIQSAGVADDESKRWKVITDPTLSRGGCRVETDVSVIDATLEKRLNALAQQFLGGAREDDAE